MLLNTYRITYNIKVGYKYEYEYKTYDNNPLSFFQSPWNQFFQDNELRLTIKQDVIRT